MTTGIRREIGFIDERLASSVRNSLQKNEQSYPQMVKEDRWKSAEKGCYEFGKILQNSVLSGAANHTIIRASVPFSSERGCLT